MTQKFLASVVFLLFLQLGYAQDTIKIMQYNLLNYGVSTGFCSESNNNTLDKDESLRTILEYAAPDIIAVNEFGKTELLQTNFINNNLNIKGATYWKSDNIINHAQSKIINHIFYNSNKMVLKKHNYIAAKYRDVDVYEFYFKTTAICMGDTTKLVYVVAHLKAGNDNASISDRNTTSQNIMNYLANHNINDNVILSGDLNMYGSDEPAYYNFTQSQSYGNALFIDPVSNADIGSWNTGSFTQYHTQSTHYNSKKCAASGGLNDRFDLFLISDEVRFGNKGLRYVTDSYKAIGNDGNHYNSAINDGDNLAVSDEIANALYTVSDHLPITIKIVLGNPLGTDEELKNFNIFASPNPATDHITLHFYSEVPQIITFDVITTTNMTARTVQTYCESGSNTFRINTTNLTDGFYIVKMTSENGETTHCKVVVKK